MFDILKMEDYLISALESFEGDPADTPYQEGYKAAIQEMLDVIRRNRIQEMLDVIRRNRKQESV